MSGPGFASAVHEVADAAEANELFQRRGWTDGLPIVPPTADRVTRMLSQVTRGRHEVVARVAPAFGGATLERIAIKAATRRKAGLIDSTEKTRRACYS